MNILYLGYWSAGDSLTKATIVPHLETLATFPSVDKIIFCSVERGSLTKLTLPGAIHIPLISKERSNVLLTKIADYFLIFRELRSVCSQYSVDVVICRSPLAGAFGHRLWRSMRIPYIVESFEPHRDYMVESDVWKWYDLRSITGCLQELAQKRSARCLLPVSVNYAKKLRDDAIPSERIVLLPCCVDIERFAFNERKRMMVRARYSIPPDAVTGIYVGKFGGIYYWEEAFLLYKKAFDFFGENFRLIILSDHPAGEIVRQLKMHSIDPERVIIKEVPHHEVNEYLSAADFAFCTIKPAPSRRYCSPVKIGEYWANGLPVILEPGIGDDSEIVEKEGGGVVITSTTENEAFEKLRTLLSAGRGSLAALIREIAHRHRGPELIKKAYEKVLLHSSD